MSFITKNSSAKTDRGNQLAGVQAGWNVFNSGMPLSNTQAKAGQDTTQTGLSNLDTAGGYWKDILSGNRTATMTAAAPAVNAEMAQADAARREQATMGTSRGGGVAAANQQAQSAGRAAIDNDIFNTRPVAAQAVQSIGTAQTQVGNQQLVQSLQALGLSAEQAKEIIDSSMQSRATSLQANPLHAIPSALISGALTSVGL